MKRRDFLRIAGSGAMSGWTVAGPCDDPASAAAAGTPNVRDLFESDNAEVLALAQRVFEKCILDKLRSPVEPLRQTWVQPGGPSRTTA